MFLIELFPSFLIITFVSILRQNAFTVSVGSFPIANPTPALHKEKKNHIVSWKTFSVLTCL